MKVGRYLLNSLAMAVCIIGSLLISYAFAKALLSPAQLSYQTPIAVVLAIGFFILWAWAAPKFLPNGLALKTRKEYLLIYLLSFLWTPLVELLARMSAFNFLDLMVVWWFQFPVGLVAEMLAAYIVRAESSPARRIFRR